MVPDTPDTRAAMVERLATAVTHLTTGQGFVHAAWLIVTGQPPYGDAKEVRPGKIPTNQLDELGTALACAEDQLGCVRAELDAAIHGVRLAREGSSRTVTDGPDYQSSDVKLSKASYVEPASSPRPAAGGVCPVREAAERLLRGGLEHTYYAGQDGSAYECVRGGSCGRGCTVNERKAALEAALASPCPAGERLPVEREQLIEVCEKHGTVFPAECPDCRLEFEQRMAKARGDLDDAARAGRSQPVARKEGEK